MEKEIRDMNVKELKALAKERGIKRYYWLRKAQLIESLETETPPTEAPETEIMEAPETEIMEAPETEIMEAPETEIMDEPVPEIMDEPVPEIMDEPVPEIKKPVLSPDKMENISSLYHPWWGWQKSKRIWCRKLLINSPTGLLIIFQNQFEEL